LSLTTTIKKALRERVMVVEKGRQRQISKLEAAIKQLVNRAVKGDARAVQQLLGLAPLFDQEAASAPSATDGEADQAVIAGILKRLGRADPAKEAASHSTEVTFDDHQRR
jgi:hypothetical protein